jgi:hypothetical protein
MKTNRPEFPRRLFLFLPVIIVGGRKEFGNAYRQINNLPTFPLSLLLLSPRFLFPQRTTCAPCWACCCCPGWVGWRRGPEKRSLHCVSRLRRPRVVENPRVVAPSSHRCVWRRRRRSRMAQLQWEGGMDTRSLQRTMTLSFESYVVAIFYLSHTTTYLVFATRWLDVYSWGKELFLELSYARRRRQERQRERDSEW